MSPLDVNPVALGQEGPTVDLGVLGVLRGKSVSTVGNMDHEPRPYYSFRNIPYAESVSGQKRFTVMDHRQ